MQPVGVGIELLVRAIADRDDQPSLPPSYVGQATRSSAGQLQSGPTGRAESTRMDSVCRMGPGRLRGRVDELIPQCCRELAARRIRGTDEQRRPRPALVLRQHVGEDVPVQAEVTATSVSVRARPRDESGGFEHVEMMSEQVRRDPEPGLELDGGRSATESSSTIANRIVSPSAAWRAARNSTDGSACTTRP
jgi:hypothetical protein